jgi:hypothetical protein
MKAITNKILSATLLIAAVSGLAACGDNDMETYDNKAFSTSDKVNTILVVGTNNEENGTIKTAIAKPEDTEVKVTYGVDNSKVEAYNGMYGEKAITVPSANYELQNAVSTIQKGALTGSDVTVHFKDLNSLDRDKVYVLPISVTSSTIDVLRSTKTTYFVIRGGALINTTADITKNFLKLKDAGTSTLGGMQNVSVEALVKVNVFGKLISTVMGIEGKFLLRAGDAGLADSQLQLATSDGNVTDASWTIPTGEWVHIALTFNGADGETAVYINGVKKGSSQYSKYRGNIDWNTKGFYVGKSYDENRWLEGCVSEMRVWNRVLTADEIKAKNHFYTVDNASDGLVAYWKFNEGGGSEIADYTGHGNTLVANSSITWKSVSLPK